jgi:hypothetical protein
VPLAPRQVVRPAAGPTLLLGCGLALFFACRAGITCACTVVGWFEAIGWLDCMYHVCTPADQYPVLPDQ